MKFLIVNGDDFGASPGINREIHPGYVDPEYPSGHSVEREAELRAWCAPRVRRVLLDESIQLVNYHQAGQLLEHAPA